MRTEDFEQYVIKQSDGCWIWKRYLNHNGYPEATFKSKTYRVNREVTRLFHGDPQPGQEVLHSCDVRACLNPAHMRWGTRAENMQDMKSRGRVSMHNRPAGMDHYKTKLSAQQVQDILAALARGEMGKDIAERYGVGRTTISRINQRNHWSL